MTKIALRHQMSAVLGGISPEQRKCRSLDACRRMAETPEFRNAHFIMLYLPMDTELAVDFLADLAWQQGKKVALPATDWPNRRIVPLLVDRLDAAPHPLIPGLREPGHGDPIEVARLDIVIAPGIAFDPAGNRLGRGKGFYDRFLGRPDLRAIRSAICFDEQILPNTMPVEPHDVAMQLIATDKAVLRPLENLSVSPPG